MGFVAQPTGHFLPDQRFRHLGPTGAIDEPRHRMFGDRVVLSKKGIEADHFEVPRALASQYESTVKPDVAVLVHVDPVLQVTPVAQVVPGRPQEVLIRATVGLVTTVASDPRDRPVNAFALGTRLVLMAIEANAATRCPQEFRLTGCMGRMAVHALHRLHGGVGNRGIGDRLRHLVVAGLAQGVASPTLELLGRTSVAIGAALAERRVDRSVGDERLARRAVGIVAVEAVGGRHLRPEVQPLKIGVRRVVAGATEFVPVIEQHRGPIGRMRVVTSVAAIFQRCVGAGALRSLGDVRVARETELAAVGLEQVGLIRKMGVVALHAPALFERGVHHPFARIRIIAMARLTEGATLLQQTHPCPTRCAMARIARTLLKGHVS